MVARGDLGVEIGPALVPLLQKRIIHRALERGKPVITATQMLESMIHSAEPTRAEASDVANAILDGTSAVMLSGETAVGEYPVEAVAYMDRIARAIEPSMGYRHELPEANENPTIGGAMSNAACDLAEALRAKAILVPTFTGKTPSAVARLRPRRPIVALTHTDWAMRQLALEWGVTPLLIPETSDVEELWNALDRRRARGRLRRGRRPRRDHRRHRGEHPRLDERDQGRRRLAGRDGASKESARATENEVSVPRARRSIVRRWLAVGALVARRVSSTTGRCGRTSTRAAQLNQHRAAVPPARGARRRRSSAGSAASTSLRDARPRGPRGSGYVKPGEHLYIVKGIPAWRQRERAMMGPGAR